MVSLEQDFNMKTKDIAFINFNIMIVNRNPHRKPLPRQPLVSVLNRKHSLTRPCSTLKRSCSTFKSKQKHVIPYQSQQERREVMNTLNKVLNIRVERDIHYSLLRSRLQYAVGSHLSVSEEGLFPRDRVGEIILMYGNVVKKCCEVVRANPYFKFAKLLKQINAIYINNILVSPQELKQYNRQMLQLYQYQSIQSTQEQSSQDINKQNRAFNPARKPTGPTIPDNRIRFRITKSASSPEPQNKEQKQELKERAEQKLQKKWEGEQVLCEAIKRSIREMDLGSLVIVGIVENDYQKKGHYSIVLIRQKSNLESQHLVLFFKTGHLQLDVLKRIGNEYQIGGYIRNQQQVDLESYWQENLELHIL